MLVGCPHTLVVQFPAVRPNTRNNTNRLFAQFPWSIRHSCVSPTSPVLTLTPYHLQPAYRKIVHEHFLSLGSTCGLRPWYFTQVKLTVRAAVTKALHESVCGAKVKTFSLFISQLKWTEKVCAECDIFSRRAFVCAEEILAGSEEGAGGIDTLLSLRGK